MRALQFDERLHLTDAAPEPLLAPGEVPIRLRLAGVCHTDLELTRGYLGFRGTLGHEFVGEVAADSEGWKAGQRVVGEINIACGACDYCRAAYPSQCRNRSTLGIANYDGVFADMLKLPAANLYAVPDSVPDDVAVFTEPLAAALQLTKVTPVLPTDRVVIIGAGKLGLLIAQVLKLTGCDLVVVARRPRPVALLEAWGIPHVMSADNLPKLSAHMVVDVTGNAEGFAAALDLVRPGGTISLKSTYADLPHADLSRVVVNEIRVVGTRCGPFEAALRLMQAGLIDTESMIDARYPLGDAVAAFDHAAQPGTLKVLLTP